MNIKDIIGNSEINQKLTALINNSNAVQAIGEVVGATLGPKGLDCMLVDEYGGIMVTNDGVTILRTMDVNHPAARIVISAAERQEEQVGDGTTTTTVMAQTLIAAGVNQVIKGVPVNQVIEGMRIGIKLALEMLTGMAVLVPSIDSPILKRIALIAGREHFDLAELIVKAVQILGEDRLRDPGFKLADQVAALEGAVSALIQGTVIEREPLNIVMPRQFGPTKILILDDSLEPDLVAPESLGTEIGIQQKIQNEAVLIANIRKLADLGVQAIFTDRAISNIAEEELTDLGILGVQKVARYDWLRLAEMSGARPIKKSSLAKSAPELGKLIGTVAGIIFDEKYKQTRVLATPERPFVTILVGAYTKEVVSERERIAKDAAAAVQAAWNGGVVSGGGSVELGIAFCLERQPLGGMPSFGYDCVIEALKQPMALIVANAGFNPLEKIAEVLSLHAETNCYFYGVNCDTGRIEDLTQSGIWDPFYVKYSAIQSAGEVAEAILRINTVIKMKERELNLTN
jgi:chaperonin GroEL (HSP60 family)